MRERTWEVVVRHPATTGSLEITTTIGEIHS